MKNIVIIDGYNVIQRTRKFQGALDSSLESARTSFINSIKCYCANKHRFDEIIVVFDAGNNAGCDNQPRRYKNGAVTVVFSSLGESADDTIRLLIRDSSRRSKLTVISDDNYVANSARTWGVDIMSCKNFIDLISQNNKKQCFEGDEKKLSHENMTDINEQLKNMWRIK